MADRQSLAGQARARRISTITIRISSRAACANGFSSRPSCAAEPSILLMDEPFGALDAQTRTVIEDDFLRLWRESGMTVLFVTHDLAEAMQCARASSS